MAIEHGVLSSFVPQDRLVSLAAGTRLPRRCEGAALFADIVGFTALTDDLVQSLGPERSAEEITLVLNRVFAALVDAVEWSGGSVVSFAGDALICWFDGDDGFRATAAGLAMRDAMLDVSRVGLRDGSARPLNVRVAVAAGTVGRLLLGDPAIQVVEALAGRLMESLASGHHAARPGEVVVDDATCAALEGRIELDRWREAGGDGRCAVVSRLVSPFAKMTSGQTDAVALEDVRPWVPRSVSERLSGEHGEPLGEIRPAVALFVGLDGFRLEGENGTADDGGPRLNAYVCRVQSVLTRYGGTLVDVTIGDKGVYLFGAFGVPVAHGDDLLRAVTAAHELRERPAEVAVTSVRLGLASGPVYAGVYGAPRRRCYGIKGTTVNVAARLMEHAAPGKVLLSGGFGASSARRFEIRPLPPQFLKGHTAPVPTSELVGPREQHAVRLPEPQYTVPIVGRRAELRRALAMIRLAAGGQGQVLGVSGDPGMGKSRFLAEVVQLATAAGFEALIGAVDSFGTSVPYLAWRPLWRPFFGLAPDASDDEQVAELGDFLARIDHALPSRLPLLGPLLGLAIPENEITGPIPVPARKRLVADILLQCLAERAAQQPLLLALEDCHWFDSLSIELLDDVRARLSDLPVLLAATYRPAGTDGPSILHPDGRENHLEIRLEAFSEDESAELIHLKLGELFGLAADAPDELVRRVSERAQGNPYFLEELLNNLNDLGLDPHDVAAIDRVELPTTLRSLILDRLDRLPSDQQLTLKAAAVVGRRFRAEWLWGTHPELGTEAAVRSSLDALARLDLIAHDAPAPEFAYLFKHVATWDVVYQSLPFATRETWHENLGSYLERELAASRPVELLAYHYGRSGDRTKELQYVLLAGEQAVAQGAYREASEYLERGIDVVAELGESADTAGSELALHLGIGGVLLTTQGQGSPEAKTHFDRSMELTARVPPGPDLVRAQFGLWTYYLFRGDMRPTEDLARQILGAAERLRNPEVLLEAHFAVSATVFWLGDFAGTVEHADEVNRFYDPDQAALYVARYAQNPRITAAADAAWSEWILGRVGAARRRAAEAVAHARELGHEFVLTIALQIPAVLSLHMADVAATGAAAEEWLAAANRVGNPVYTGFASACLGWAKAASGEAEEGLAMLQGVRQGFLDQGVEIIDPLLATAHADACLRCGEAEVGLAILDGALTRAVAKDQSAYLAEQHRLRGELTLLAGGEASKAEADFRRAVAIAREQGASAFELRAALSLATFLQGDDRAAEAETLLRAARAAVTEGDDTTDVQAADAVLARSTTSALEAQTQ